MQVSDSALDWLLEDDDPSVRYRTLTELLGRGATEREPAAARMAIPDSPAVAAALEPLAADGSWQYAHRDQPNRYLKFVTASLSYIAELGLDRDDPRASSAVEHLFSLQQEDGDFFRHYSCYNGLILRTLNRLGFRDDRRTARLRELLLNSIRHDGGFHCDIRPKRGRDASPPYKSCIKGSLKALLAFAEDPELRGTEECEMVAGYFLRRHVCFRTDDLSTPVVPQLLQLSFPIIYRPGLVEALYAMSALGYGRRPAMDRAWASLAGRQRPDGRFALEASVNWPHLRTTPRGHANKWITLYACLALKHRERRTAAKGNGQGAKENGGRQTTTTGGSATFAEAWAFAKAMAHRSVPKERPALRTARPGPSGQWVAWECNPSKRPEHTARAGAAPTFAEARTATATTTASPVAKAWTFAEATAIPRRQGYGPSLKLWPTSRGTSGGDKAQT